MKFIISKAAEKDIPVIQQITHATWPVAYGEILSAHQLEYMLALIYSDTALQQQMQDGQQFYIIYKDDKPVGFAAFGAYKSDDVYKLHKLYVLPETQGSGAGKTLLHFVIDACKNAGAKTLLLNVNRHNKAKLFYEKNGFVVSHEDDIDIGNGYYMTDYIMQLQF